VSKLLKMSCRVEYVCVIAPDSIDEQIHDRSQAIQEFGPICRPAMLSELNTEEQDSLNRPYYQYTNKIKNKILDIKKDIFF